MFLFMISMTACVLALTLMLVQTLLSGGFYTNSAPFECGFNNKGSVNISYSVYFYLLLLVFVLFDLEIVMLLAFLFNSVAGMFLFFILVSFIFFTYYLEVFFNKIVWKI